MALVTAATIRLSVPQLLSLVAAGGLLLASVNGCTAAMAAADNQPAAPEESDPQAPPMQPETQPDARLRVGVTADARTVVEGEAATFTVTAAGAPSSGPMVVDYTVSGTASAASDYLLPSSTTTLSRGASQAKITIPTLTDNEVESQETISVALDRASTPIGTVDVDTTPATVTIAEPGTAIVSVAPAPAPAPEGAPAAFVVTVSGAVRSNVTVSWKSADGTAVAGTDYTAVTGGTLAFGATRRQTIRVATLQDKLNEDDETFAVILTAVSPSAGASLGRASATGTITDDDELPELTVIGGDALEDAGSLAFRVRLAPASGRLVTVLYRTVDDTAAAGQDYLLTDGTLRFTPGGPLEQTIVIPITDDSDDEADEESFKVRLHSPVNATLRDAEATGTITDNDDSRPIIESPPHLDIADSSANGPSGTIGLAGPCLWRPGGLPLIGDLTIDTADLARLGTVGLQRLAVHEMAHVLGYGSSGEWDHLLRNSAVEYLQNNPGQSTLPDTHFAGQAARNAFNEIGGNSYSGGEKVPVENNTARYGAGGLDGHWRESVFGDELMTPTISVNAQTAQPLSKVTIASLTDLGYRVDLTQADSFSLPSTTQSLLRVQYAQDEVSLGDHIRRGPMIVAEMPE